MGSAQRREVSLDCGTLQFKFERRRAKLIDIGDSVDFRLASESAITNEASFDGAERCECCFMMYLVQLDPSLRRKVSA